MVITNDHGYNEFAFIQQTKRSEPFGPEWQLTTNIFMVKSNHGYKEQIFSVPWGSL